METKDKGQVFYYYDREKRLERASDNAQFIIDRHGAKRPGLLKSLTATPALRYLFFAVLFMSVAALVVGYVDRTRNTGTLAGYSLSAEAMWFEGHVYVTLTKGLSWYARLGEGLGGKAPPLVAIGVAVGDGTSLATGVMQAAESDIRLRFPAESKPSLAFVVATLGEGDTERVQLSAKVK